MNKIEVMQFVSNDDGETFYKETRSAIDNFQDAGYEIEVQYQATLTHFSALIIGRKKK